MVVRDFISSMADIWSRVDLDSSLSDQIPKEFVRSYPKGTLLGVELYIKFSEESKCFLQVLYVVGAVETLHKHVVYVHLHCILISSLKTLLTIGWKVDLTFFWLKGMTL